MNQKNIFRKGVYSFYTPVIGASDLPPGKIKNRIMWSNTPKRLKTFFFGSEVLVLKKIYNGHIKIINSSAKNFSLIKNKYWSVKKALFFVSIKRPTSGYSEIALMSVAGRFLQINGNSKKNDLIYDYPINVQRVYWETALQVFSKYFQHKDNKMLSLNFLNMTPVLIGHHGRELSKYPPVENIPGIRSVILHHDHILFINKENILPEYWDEKTFNLNKESSLYWDNKTNYLCNLIKILNNDKRIKRFKHTFICRKKRPMGYETLINYNNRNIKHFTEFLYTHFLVYCDHINDSQLLLKSELIQPAFTFYLFPIDNKKALIIFSPNILAGDNKIVAGGPERAGILIHRRPDIPPTISEKEKNYFYNSILKI